MTGCMTSHPAETPVPPVFAELLGRIESGSATIGICGLGYVGLPLAKAAFDGSRFHIIGFDIDADKIRQLNAKQSYIRCVASATIAQMIDTGRFEATDDFNRIAELDAVLICVPTPLSKYREPDLSFVVDTARTISRNARPGQLIILESTTYPGTTRDVLKPIFEERGLSDGTEIFLAFSPSAKIPAIPATTRRKFQRLSARTMTVPEFWRRSSMARSSSRSSRFYRPPPPKRSS